MEQPGDALNSIVEYYSNQFEEQSRLSSTFGQIELVRTQGIIRRYLKPPPGLVLDVGGAAGRYACWLARAGYEVHLIDPVPLHVEQALGASAAQPGVPIASCALGDARRLEFGDCTADAVLLMGPLYHLVESQDRHRALSEARRTLKPGGCLFAAAISRWAPSIDGLVSGYALDPVFRELMLRVLSEGRHRNPTRNPAYFTTAFFHRPDELADEVLRAGFCVTALLAIEGLGYLVKDLDEWWASADRRELLLDLLGRLEQEPSLLGASPHLMCVAERP